MSEYWYISIINIIKCVQSYHTKSCFNMILLENKKNTENI